jgi:hypothetical protein
MRFMLIGILGALCFTGCGQVPTLPPPEVFEKEPLDQRISQIKEQIQIYQERAEYCDRMAEQIMTRDWIAFREYTAEEGRCTAIVQKLQKELSDLEAEKQRQGS